MALRQLQQQDEDEFPLPALADLQAPFVGNVNFAWSPTLSPVVNLGVEGEDWQWGELALGDFVAEGSYANQVLSLRPIRLVSNDILLSFTGDLGPNQASGQLRAESVPLELVQAFVDVPAEIEGNANLIATLSGSFSQPQLVGELVLADVELNDVPIEGGTTTFAYDDARLRFQGNLVAAETDNPLQVRGSLPVPIPVAPGTPESNQFGVFLTVEDDGLELVNALSNQQVQWLDGEGDIDVVVEGTIQQTEQGLDINPVLVGEAVVADATIAASVLPEPLTDVTGRVLFDLDRFQVETLTAQLSDGSVAAAGTLPILNPDLAVEEPLLITLDELELEISDFYDGGVSGEVQVAGAAIAPEIGGFVNLDDTDVTISNTLLARLNPNVGTLEAGAPTRSVAQNQNPLRFNQFQINLGEDFSISRRIAPAQLGFNVQARGDVTLNGPLDDLRPKGRIELPRGRVGILGTVFILSNQQDNVAVFRPEYGTQPYIDLLLVTSVSDVSNLAFSAVTEEDLIDDLFAPPEIGDTVLPQDFAVERIRVQASFEGFPTQLSENLVLTSDPSLPEGEILALLSENVISDVVNAPTALLLSGLNNLIGGTLNLPDLRVFQVPVTPDGGDDPVFATAAELGFDISRNLSVSVIEVLTLEEPTQFGIRYSPSRNWTVRGTTNLSGDSRAYIEYRIRF
jgi:translocation and assembly module TamB